MAVKEASLEYTPPPDNWAEESAESADAGEPLVNTDPTIANASLTELQEPPVNVQATPVNGVSATETHQPDDGAQPPSQSVVNPGAANAVAESDWDGQTSSATAEGWVEVERNPTETNTSNTPAPAQNPNSWAEDVPTSAPATLNEGTSDGFEQVTHHARQNSGRGRGPRGGRPFRGDFRGRSGFYTGSSRGRGRGRGNGEFRGGNGEFRGGRGRGGFGGRGGYPREGQAPAGSF